MLKPPIGCLKVFTGLAELFESARDIIKDCETKELNEKQAVECERMAEQIRQRLAVSERMRQTNALKKQVTK